MNNNVCRVYSCCRYCLCPRTRSDRYRQKVWMRRMHQQWLLHGCHPVLIKNTKKKIHLLYVSSIWFRWRFGSVIMRWSRWSNSKLGPFNTGIFGQKTISVCKQPPRSSACQPGHPFVGRQAQLSTSKSRGIKRHITHCISPISLVSEHSWYLAEDFRNRDDPHLMGLYGSGRTLHFMIQVKGFDYTVCKQ